MPKVYIVSNNGYNFEPASEYGELVFLTSGFVDVHKNLEQYREKFENILKGFDSEQDYLLLVGSNLLCVLAFSYVVHSNLSDPNTIKILQWNPLQNKYVEYTI